MNSDHNEIKVTITYEGNVYENRQIFSTISLLFNDKPFDLIKAHIVDATNRILEDMAKVHNKGE